MLIFKHVVYWVLYWVSFLPRRNPKIWVFGANKTSFNDNAKYLYLNVSRSTPQVRAIWITRSESIRKELLKLNLESYHPYSLKGIWYCLNAGVSIFSHSFMGVSVFCGGSLKVGLWHGIPLKKMGKDIEGATGFKKILNSISLNHKHYYDLFLSPSKEFTRVMNQAYDIPIENFVQAKYPRLEPFFDTEPFQKYCFDFEAKVFEEVLGNYSRVILYMPTWRDDNSDLIGNAFPDIHRLNHLLDKQNTLFIVKAHELNVKNRDIDKLSNILFIKNNIDVYPFLKHIDCLITDYSSVFFDFYLLEKPIIYYAFDKLDYLKYRGLYYNYDEVCVGEHVDSFDELCNLLSEESYNLKTSQKIKIKELITTFWSDSIWDKNEILLKSIFSSIES
ncbi:CDP-glycerol glycerophosphotransferase family protein [Flectobacillus roseus]